MQPDHVGFLGLGAEDWIALFTVVLAIATILLAVFTAKLWSSTKQLVEGADKTAQRQLRAYVCVSGANILPTQTPDVFYIRIQIKNVGMTPAYKFVGHLNAEICNFPGVPNLNLPIPPLESKSTVGADQTMDINLFYRISAADWQAIQARTKAIYAYGRLDYEDIFGNQWYTNYRAARGRTDNLPEGLLAACEEGNEAT
ncbi:MAG: hypothetical protein DYH13_01880 [Alphaproteobacteria bacterium PRO2]|nr:hypothetical protein [Alphaproteobacteria bacterium PRO2]